MARTANVFVRVEPELKEQAEQILEKLGIPMSNAVGMFLRQVVMHRGIPFDVKLPNSEALIVDNLSKEQFDMAIMEGIEEVKTGKGYTLEEIRAEMEKKLGE